MTPLRRAALAGLLAALALPAEAKPKRAPAAAPAASASAAPHAAIAPVSGGERIDLVLDGALAGWAAPRETSGGRTLYLLVGPVPAPGAPAPTCAVSDAGPAAEARDRRLFRWRPERPGALDLVRADLPDGALEAADLDGDGGDELLLLRPGEIDAVRTASGGEAIREVARDARIGRIEGDPRIARGDGAGDEAAALRIALVGAFGTWRPGPDGLLRESGEIDLPLSAEPGRASARVTSPRVEPIGRGASGRPLYATDPETVGFERVRTFLLDPEAPEGGRRLECWMRFPGRERLLERGFGILDGRPVLVALSMDADTLSVFAGKKLRVFPLGGDRTRAGAAPLLAVETDVNLWQAATPAVFDLDGDGRDDLVLAYWKGLKNTIAALEVHRQGEGGAFEKGRTLEFDVAGGAPPFLGFGGDLDGDGRRDLLLFAGGALQVYPGSPAGEAARRPVATRPSLVVPLAAQTPAPAGLTVSFEVSSSRLSIGRSLPGLGDPRLVDLDGDGRPEVLFLGNGREGGRGSIVFVRAAGKGPSPAPPKARVAPARNSPYK